MSLIRIQSNKMFAECVQGDISSLRKTLASSGDLRGFDLDFLFRVCLSENQIGCAKELLPHISLEGAKGEDAFFTVFSSPKKANEEMIDFLIKSGARPKSTRALSKAAEQGLSSVVELLMPFYDLEKHAQDGFNAAVLRGHMDILVLLSPFSKKSNETALMYGAVHGCPNIMSFLINDSRVTDSLLMETMEVALESNNIDCAKVLFNKFTERWAFEKSVKIALKMNILELLVLAASKCDLASLATCLSTFSEMQKVETESQNWLKVYLRSREEREMMNDIVDVKPNAPRKKI